MPRDEREHLGTGLEKIFGEHISSMIEDIQNNANLDDFGRRISLKVDDVHPNPYQPRRTFDQSKLQELANSINEHGVFTPILVRKAASGYELIAGERRLRASKLAGKEEIPAILVEFDDTQMMEISLLENIQREDLSVIEEANAYQQLLNNLNYTQEQLAQRIGKSREHVSNTLRLLKLPQSIQQMVVEGKLSMGQVRPLIALESETEIKALANKIVNEQLTVREVEKLVRGITNVGPKIKQPKELDAATLDVQRRLQRKYSTRVKITNNSINFSYADIEDFNRIIEMLGGIDEEL